MPFHVADRLAKLEARVDAVDETKLTKVEFEPLDDQTLKFRRNHVPHDAQFLVGSRADWGSDIRARREI